jgi:prolyl-tRNA synthetase
LGTRYSAATNATYLDEHNEPKLIYMGSYGIGLDRLMAVIVEKHNDKDGIVWPDSVAPFHVHLMWLGKGGQPEEVAERLFEEMGLAGIEVYYDDRKASAGVKFKDADLIGIPWRVTVGDRGLAQGVVEVKRRDSAERQQVPLDEIIEYLRSKL